MVKYVLVKYVTETKVLNVFAATKRLRPSPLFFHFASNAFPDIGSVGRNEKKKPKKNHKKSRNRRPWYPRVTLKVNIYIWINKMHNIL